MYDQENIAPRSWTDPDIDPDENDEGDDGAYAALLDGFTIQHECLTENLQEEVDNSLALLGLAQEIHTLNENKRPFDFDAEAEPEEITHQDDSVHSLDAAFANYDVIAFDLPSQLEMSRPENWFNTHCPMTSQLPNWLVRYHKLKDEDQLPHLLAQPQSEVSKPEAGILTPVMCYYSPAVAWDDCLPDKVNSQALPYGWCYLSGIARHLRYVVACHYGAYPDPDELNDDLMQELRRRGMLLPINIIDTDTTYAHPDVPDENRNIYHVVMSKSGRLYLDVLQVVSGLDAFFGAIPVRMPQETIPETLPSGDSQNMRWLMYFTLLLKVFEYLCSTRVVKKFWHKVSCVLDKMLESDARHRKFKNAFQEAASVLGQEDKFRAEGSPEEMEPSGIKHPEGEVEDPSIEKEPESCPDDISVISTPTTVSMSSFDTHSSRNLSEFEVRWRKTMIKQSWSFKGLPKLVGCWTLYFTMCLLHFMFVTPLGLFSTASSLFILYTEIDMLYYLTYYYLFCSFATALFGTLKVTYLHFESSVILKSFASMALNFTNRDTYIERMWAKIPLTLICMHMEWYGAAVIAPAVSHTALMFCTTWATCTLDAMQREKLESSIKKKVEVWEETHGVDTETQLPSTASISEFSANKIKESFGRITPPKVLKFLAENEELPETPPPSKLTEHEKMLHQICEQTNTKVILNFIVTMVTAGRPSEVGMARSVAQHTANVAGLITALSAINKDKTAFIIKTIASMTGCVFKAEAEGKDSDEEGGWLNTLASGMESISRFDTSPVCNVVSEFMGFVVTLPILFFDLCEADSFIKIWKIVVKTIKKTGLSLSSIIRGVVGIHTTCVAASASSNPGATIWEIFKGDVLSMDFVDCQAVMRSIREGTFDHSKNDISELRLRLLRLRQKASVQASRPTAGVLDMNRLDNVNKMVEALTRHVKTSEERRMPFTVSFHGGAGIGKTAFRDHCIDLMHQWVGMGDVQRVSNVNINIPHDSQTDNSTTCVSLDDQGNLATDKRIATLGGKLNEINQPSYTEVPKADLPDKGIHFYQNVFTVLVDNKARRGIESEMMEPLAGFRRLGNVVECRLRPEYSKDGMFNSAYAKGRNIAFGEHLEFRFFKFVQEESEPCEMRAESDWMNHQDFFETLRKNVLEHFEAEKQRISQKKAHKQMKLCTKCNVLPPTHCKCGTSFMDCEESSESDEDSDSDSESGFEAEAFACSDLFNVFDVTGINVPEWYAERLAIRMVCYVRFIALGTGNLSRAVDWLAKYPIHHAVLFFLMLGSWTHVLLMPTLYTVPACLVFTMLFAASQKLLQVWKQLSMHTTTDLVRLQVANLNRMGNKTYYAIISALGCLTAMVVFKPLCAAFLPDKFVAEAQPTEETTEGAEVVIHPPKESGPSWKIPVRHNVEAMKAAKTTSSTDIAVMVGNNQFVMTVIRPTGERVPAIGMMWNEDYLGLPTHILYSKTVGYGTTDFEVYDHRNRRTVKFTVYTSSMYIMGQKDYTWIYLPNKELGTIRNLVPYLALESGFGRASYMHIMRDRENPDTMKSGGMFPVKCIGTESDCTYTLAGEEITNGQVYQMTTNISTGNGACGSVYVREDAPRTIAAVHTAGNKNGLSIAVPLNRGMYDEAEKFFAETACKLPSMELGARPKRILGYATKIVHQANKTHPVWFVNDDDRNLEVHGEVVSQHMPRSNVRYSDYIVEAKKYLKAKVLKIIPKPKWRETVRKILLPATERKKLGDPALLYRAADILKNDVAGYTKKFQERYAEHIDLDAPLSVTNVLNGVDNTPFYCLKTNTSPGFPGRGKKWWYIDEVDGIKVPKTELMYSMIESMDKLVSGEDPGHTASVALKDEAVKVVETPNGPEPKVCRGMFPSPLVQHIECCSFLLTQVNVASSYPEAFSTAIGKNREGPDWEDMAKKFCHPAFVNNCADTDYANCDVSQSPQLRTVACSIYCEQAKELEWGEEDQTILKRILSTLIAPIVNMGGTLIRLWNILLSGFLITADLNGKVSLILRRADFLRFWDDKDFNKLFTAYIKKHPDELKYFPYASKGFNKYSEHCIDTTLGDDMVIAVSNFLRWSGWDPNHFKETCAMYGMTVTAADKSESIYFKNFEDCEFLKSHTNWHPDLQMNVSVIGPKSYLQPFVSNIRGKDWNAGVYYADVAENAMRSAFFGGRKSYECIYKRLSDFFSHVDLPTPPILSRTYDEWVELMKPESPQTRLFQVQDRGMQLIEEYDSLQSAPMPTSGSAPFVAEAEPEPANIEEGILQTDEAPVEVAGMTHPQVETDHVVQSNTGLKEKIDRKVLLNTLVWDATQPDNYHLYPYRLMMEQPLFKEMFSYIAMWRSALKITFEVTSNSSVAGSLLVSQTFAPEIFSDTHNVKGYSRMSALCYHSQKPHIVIKAGVQSGSYEMIVPFVHLASKVYTNDLRTIQYLCKLEILQIAPLISATGHVPTSTIKVYGQFIDMVTTGATSFEKPEHGPAPFRAEAEPEEKFSSKVSAVAHTLDRVSEIPGMSAMALPAQIAAAGAGLSHMWGFGRPQEVDSNNVTPVVASGFSNMRGNFSGGVLSPDPSQAISPSGGVSGFPADELQIANYTSEFSIIDQFTVSTSDAYNAEVWGINVTPAIYLLAAGSVGGNANFHTLQPARLAVPCNFFNEWRGSIVYKFVFDIPASTTCRLMFYYDSLCDSHNSRGDVSSEEDFVESANVDVATSQEVTFTVGYTSSFPALNTLPRIGSLTAHQYANYAQLGTPTDGFSKIDNSSLSNHWKGEGHNSVHGGQLKARVQSKLTTNMGTDLTIRCTVWAKGGPDLEFGIFSGGMPSGTVMPSRETPNTVATADYQPDELAPYMATDYAVETVGCTTAVDDVCVTAQGVPSPTTITTTNAPVTFSPAGLAPPKDTPVPGGTPTTQPSLRPSTGAPSTLIPGTPGPTTQYPSTASPSTANPTTSKPTTSQPTTSKPTTSQPTTAVPTTSEPTTARPSTSQPTTASPTTSQPTTANPTTSQPTTANPTTSQPSTASPTTSQPSTARPTTNRPTTFDPTTGQPSTVGPTTLSPTTAVPSALASSLPSSAPTTVNHWNLKGLCGIIGWDNTVINDQAGVQFFGEQDIGGYVALEGGNGTSATFTAPTFVRHADDKPVVEFWANGGDPWGSYKDSLGAPIGYSLWAEGPASARNEQHLMSASATNDTASEAYFRLVNAYVSIPFDLKYDERPPFGSESWAPNSSQLLLASDVTIQQFPSFGSPTTNAEDDDDVIGETSTPVYGMQWPGGPKQARDNTWLPNEYADYEATLTNQYDLSPEVQRILNSLGCTEVYGCVTFIGTIIITTNLEVKTVTSNNWARQSFKYTYGSDVFFDTGTEGWIRSWAFLTHVNAWYRESNGVRNWWELIIAEKSQRRTLLSKFFAEAEPEPTENSFRFGSHSGKDDFAHKVLWGEVHVSFRPLMKIPQHVYTLQVNNPNNSHSSVTFQSYMYLDASNSSKTTVFQYMLYCYDGMKGGIVNHYHVAGDGILEITKLNSTSTFHTNFGNPGTEIMDSRVQPHISIKYPYQCNLEYCYARGFMKSPPNMRKDLRVHAWREDVRVRVYRSTGEDFSYMIFAGASPFHIRVS